MSLSMKKRLSLASALILGGTVIAASAHARDLTIVSFGGALQNAERTVFFKPFSEESGVAIAEDSWDGGVGVVRAKVTGGNTPWDIVEVDNSELAVGCEEGLFEPLDFDRIGGADAYLPMAVSDCGVGVIVYNQVLAYDGNRLTDGPTSWADFFDLTKFPGKRALRQGPIGNLEIALMADGVATDQVYDTLRTDAGVERAFAKLESIRDNLIFWKAGAQPPQLLASGEVVMTSSYNGRISAANESDGRNFKIAWAGSVATLDSWAIIAGSPKVEEAYAFLAFAGRPEVQKDLPSHIAYGVTSVKANELIDPAKMPDLPTAPQNLSVALPYDTQFWLENTDRLTERFNSWANQ
jgi:putative spermidine/putrescine transport system substrate-binding protein